MLSNAPVYYSVSISASNLAAPGDGFIDNMSAGSYVVANGSDLEEGWASSLANAQAKARANMRWRAILQEVTGTVNPFSITNIVAEGASINSSATAMNFTICYDRPDYLYAYDELNPGMTLLNDLALKRWIARALIQNITANFSVLNPTPDTGLSQGAHYGESISETNAGPIAADIPSAEALITITLTTGPQGIPAP